MSLDPGYKGLEVKQASSLEDLVRSNAVEFSRLAVEAKDKMVESTGSRIAAIELHICAKLLNDLLAAASEL